MTTRVLPFDRSIVSQDTGYWCGPATVQNILAGLNIKSDEAQLAREMGTTVNGTNSISQLEKVLDSRVPAARYTSVYPKGRPAAERRTQFWWDIVRSIDNGFPVAVNIVAPAGKYLKGVKGSPSPNVTFESWHYIEVAGWSDEGRDGRTSVYIVDSGFWPNAYWADF